MEEKKVLERLQRQCARMEYSVSDIRRKALKAAEGDADAADRIVASLVADRFVDDRRYAAAFAREKSSLTGWGPEKIRCNLMMKGFSKADIAAALEEVDPESSAAKLEKLVAAKRKSLEGDPFIKFKLIKYALSRGYGYDTVAPLVDRILSEEY